MKRRKFLALSSATAVAVAVPAKLISDVVKTTQPLSTAHIDPDEWGRRFQASFMQAAKPDILDRMNRACAEAQNSPKPNLIVTHRDWWRD